MCFFVGFFADWDCAAWKCIAIAKTATVLWKEFSFNIGLNFFGLQVSFLTIILVLHLNCALNWMEWTVWKARAPPARTEHILSSIYVYVWMVLCQYVGLTQSATRLGRDAWAFRVKD